MPGPNGEITLEDLEEWRRRNRGGTPPGKSPPADAAAGGLTSPPAAVPITPAAVLATRARGAQRLAQIGNIGRRFITPEPMGGGVSFEEFLDLLQGGAQLGGSQLRAGLGALGDIGNRRALRERQAAPFSEELGRHLAAPARERIPAEILADPLNVLPFGLVRKGIGAGGRLASRGVAAVRPGGLGGLGGPGVRPMPIPPRPPLPRPGPPGPPAGVPPVGPLSASPGLPPPPGFASDVGTLQERKEAFAALVARNATEEEFSAYNFGGGVAPRTKAEARLRSGRAGLERTIKLLEDRVAKWYGEFPGGPTKGTPGKLEAAENIVPFHASLPVKPMPTSPRPGPEPASPVGGATPPGPPPIRPGGPDPRVPPQQDPVIQKALEVLKGVKRVSKTEQAALFSTERKGRFAKGMAASENLPVREGYRKFFGAQAGDFPRADIQPIVGEFSESEVSHLFSRIEAPGVLRAGYDRYNAAAALEDLLHPSTAKIPMPRDLALLERAFGADFVRILYNKKRTSSQAVWDEFIAAWNLPRSLVASLDLSATLRQGAMLAPGNISDWRRAVGAELKAYGSEAYAKKAWDDIYLHPNYERLTNAGLDLTQRGAIAPLLKREEAFMSRWAGHIPGVRGSERAYVTMLNKLRFDVSNKMLTQLETKGLTETELANQLKGVADFVNWTTGRGPALPSEGIQAILNGLMFSPRFTTSRFAVLKLPITAYQNPAIRGKLAKDLVEWVAVTGMVVGLAKAAGARVEIDPRSGEWGKIIVGHTRYDPWVGMQPVARLIAQLYWGQGKSSLGKLYSTDDQDLISKRQRLKSEGKGKISDEEFAKSGRFMPARLKVLQRFLRSKLQPLAGETWDQVTGEDWLGGEAELGQAFSKDPRINLFAQNLMPILAQDVLDAVVSGEHPLATAGAAGASAIGIGASTYQSTADIARERLPGVPLERLRTMPKPVQKSWAEEANRRRGFPKKMPPKKLSPSRPVPVPGRRPSIPSPYSGAAGTPNLISR